MKILFTYLLIINLIAVIICIKDKLSSRRRGRRTREKTLFTICIAGGSVAMFITMLIIRHKTKHLKFMLGIPVIIIAQAIIFPYILNIFC